MSSNRVPQRHKKAHNRPPSQRSVQSQSAHQRVLPRPAFTTSVASLNRCHTLRRRVSAVSRRASMCAASGAADTAAACDSDWQQPKARRRQPRNSSSPCGRATSSFRNHTAAKTLRDRVSSPTRPSPLSCLVRHIHCLTLHRCVVGVQQVEIAAESDAFNQLPTVEQQRRIHTVVDTVRQLLPTVTSSPLFTALRGASAIPPQLPTARHALCHSHRC